MADEHESLLRRTYAAFNRRDVEASLNAMHADVDWPNGMQGGRISGRDAVRLYWTRQFEIVDSRVEPTRFGYDEEGRVVVDVHQVVRSPAGEPISEGEVRHVYAFRDGLVERMDIAEPPA